MSKREVKKSESAYARIAIDFLDGTIKASIEHGLDKLNASKIELAKRAIFREFNMLRRKKIAGMYSQHAAEREAFRQEVIEKEQQDVR